MIDKTNSKELLLKGLAAAAIGNWAKDIRSTTIALDELYLSAEEQGFKPKSAFEAAAKFASDVPVGREKRFMKTMLSESSNYRALQDRRRMRQKRKDLQTL